MAVVVSLPAAVRGVIDPWATGPIEEQLALRGRLVAGDLDGAVLVVDAASTAVDGGSYDHVVSIARLASVDDPGDEIDRLVGLLADDGWLTVVEPSLGVGATALAQRRAATVAHERTGWWVDRDVPADLRARGLVVTDLERFSMPVPSVVLRPWVAGRARRRRPLPTQETER